MTGACMNCGRTAHLEGFMKRLCKRCWSDATAELLVTRSYHSRLVADGCHPKIADRIVDRLRSQGAFQ